MEPVCELLLSNSHRESLLKKHWSKYKNSRYLIFTISQLWNQTFYDIFHVLPNLALQMEILLNPLDIHLVNSPQKTFIKGRKTLEGALMNLLSIIFRFGSAGLARKLQLPMV